MKKNSRGSENTEITTAQAGGNSQQGDPQGCKQAGEDLDNSKTKNDNSICLFVQLKHIRRQMSNKMRWLSLN